MSHDIDSLVLDRDPAKAGAPEDAENEVTLAMIEAGCRVVEKSGLVPWNVDHWEAGELARCVFLEMSALAPIPTSAHIRGK